MKHHSGRDVWWHEEEARASSECEPEWMDAEDPLFILYTRHASPVPSHSARLISRVYSSSYQNCLKKPTLPQALLLKFVALQYFPHKILNQFWTIATSCPFILSGSTGKPKGVLHTTAGYMLYAATTFKYVFDYHPDEVFWCTADVGWITGHTYIVYGPLANGATGVIVRLS